MSEIRKWWDNLSKNWKKSLLVNFDLFYNFGFDFEQIEKEIITKGPYNAYKSLTGTKISSRFSEFNPSEKELNQMLDLLGLTIRYENVNSTIPLLKFKKLQRLCLSNFDLHSTQELITLKELKYLRLIDCNNLKNLNSIGEFTELEKLDLTYCYNIENLADLGYSQSLKEIDFSYLGVIVPLKFNLNRARLLVHKNLFHPDDNYYNRKFNQTFKSFQDFYQTGVEYKLDSTELDIIQNSDNDIIKENNEFYFGHTNKYRIGIIEYTIWEIRTYGNTV
ncbi:MAG: hypothetical protein JJ895_09485 [Balneolaceae bacterium]|nr:hypothetical protein [Balneolaceae bacterium]